MNPNPFHFCSEQVHSTAFIAEGARVLGDVTIGRDSSVWFNAVIRGDAARVTIGEGSNVQDLCMLHADPGFPCRVGDRVTIGHRAIVHGAELADDVMVGMGAIVLNGAKIGAHSVIAAGAVVTEGMEAPEGSLLMGIPAKIRGQVSDSQRDRIEHAARHYAELAHQFKQKA